MKITQNVKISKKQTEVGEYTRREEPDYPPRDVNVEALERDLEAGIKGEVRFDGGTRGLYATDHSIYRQVPIGIVIPKDNDDVVEAVAICRRHHAPILSRGCGSSLAGQTANVAVVIDFSKYMNQVLEVDARRRLARVQPGVVNDELNAAAAGYGLVFPPDPATHAWATLGGAIGNNSCGTHSLLDPPGRTSDFVEELDVLLYDGTRMTVGQTSDEELEQIIAGGGRKGEIYRGMRDLRDRCGDLVRERFPDIPRRVSGFNLDELLPENGFNVARALSGTEGTCAIVLEATLRLVDNPKKRVTVVMGYPSIFVAADHIGEIREQNPSGLEAVGHNVVANLEYKDQRIEAIDLLPEGNAWLYAEFPGDSAEEARKKAEALQQQLEGRDDTPNMVLIEDDGQQNQVWAVRESAIGASRIPGEMDTWAAWEDAAVPPERLGEYLREFEEIIERRNRRVVIFGHFGQGCVHARTDNDLKSAEGIKDFRKFMEECADLTVKYGGSLSGEHGEGQLRAELLPKMFGDELVKAFDEFKYLWDPDNKMNPRKVVSDSYKLDENLRLGAGYNPPQIDTRFAFKDDHGNFAAATERCYAFGRCRRATGGTMCPSFQATREEKHSTRGRAHLLFEMLQGEVVTGGWRDEEVFESLDLCLACKGCKGECPASVDMATYKAEFLSHYYEGRLRPMYAYTMGFIMLHARIGQYIPRLANFMTHTPGISTLVKKLGGLATEREMPNFATQTFKTWFKERGLVNQECPPVVLFPDTFNNYFKPEAAKAAVEVLEHAGYRVIVPQQPLCCGRPLFDYGMLDTAKVYFTRLIEGLAPYTREGIKVVGVEPSCIASFRDELPDLMAHNQDAIRLSKNTLTLAEFLTQEGYEPPKLDRKALVHSHCHQEHVMGINAERRLYDQMGLDYEVLDSGCCGLAGSWGFERDKYDISMQIGELGPLPAARNAEKDTIIMSDGFSCKTQIQEGDTGRRALHTAQVLKMAIDNGRKGTPHDEKPEEQYPDIVLDGDGYKPGLKTAAVAGAAVAGSTVAWGLLRRLGK